MNEKRGPLRRLMGRIFGRGELGERRPRQLPPAPPAGQQWRFDQALDRRLELSPAVKAIEQIARAHQMADAGDPLLMIDLHAKRIEFDAHLRAALDNRNEAVAQKPWTLDAGGPEEADRQAAAELELRLRLVPNFISTLEHQMTFQPFGWAASEIDWAYVDGLAAPTWFDTVSHRRFVFDPETDEMRLRTATQPEGVPLIPGKWWVSHRRGDIVAASGLMRTLVWWSTFKTLGVRDLMIFSERYGLPYVTGQYEENATDEEKDALKQALADIGADGFAAFAKTCEIVIHESKSRGSEESVHTALVSLCDAQISRLVEGATLVSSSSGNGSYALGSVHEAKYFDILRGDAEKLAQSFEMKVGLPFVRFNGLQARPPRLRMHLGLNLSMGDLVKIATTLANRLEGFEVDEEQMRTLTQLRKPRAGQGLRGVDVAKLLGAQSSPAEQPAEEE